MRYYKLDEFGNPVECNDVLEWGRWFEDAQRKGLRTVARDNIGKILISTVFLGLDHNWGDGNPILYETMIFGGKHDEYQERYCTKEEALEGHKKAVRMVKDDRK
jgi:hypothetical protein